MPAIDAQQPGLGVTLFDYLVLFIVACSVVISLLRGLVREILSLMSWIVAFFVANAYCDALAPMLPTSIPGASGRLIVAFIALFIGVKLLMLLLSRTLEAMVKASGLTVVDRGLGGIFGLTRGAVIVLAVVLLCGTTAIPQQPFWKNALLSPLAETMAYRVMPWVPGELAQHVRF